MERRTLLFYNLAFWFWKKEERSQGPKCLLHGRIGHAGHLAGCPRCTACSPASLSTKGPFFWGLKGGKRVGPKAGPKGAALRFIKGPRFPFRRGRGGSQFPHPVSHSPFWGNLFCWETPHGDNTFRLFGQHFLGCHPADIAGGPHFFFTHFLLFRATSLFKQCVVGEKKDFSSIN